MAIFIPRWDRWKDKAPLVPVEINWNSYFAQNLVGALAAHDRNATITGTCGVVTGMYNNSAINAINCDGASILSAKTIRNPVDKATIIYVGNVDLAINSIVGGFGTSSGGSQLFGIQTNPAVYEVPLRSVIRTVDAGGITTADVLLANAPGISSVNLWASVYDGTTALKIYKNGKNVTSVNSNTAATGNLSLYDKFCLGGIFRGTNSYAQTGVKASNVFGFDKAFTTEEISAFSEYPFQLYKPRGQFFFLGSGAANETADIALTTVNPTIAIGASQLQHTDVAITTTNPTIAAELSQTLHADVAITTVNPTISATVNETVVLASVALTTQNPIIAARITGGEPDFVLGGVPLHSEVKRGKRRLETDEEYEAEYNENVPVDNPLIKLDRSVTKIKESIDHAKKQADKKDEDDVKAIVQFVKEYRSNIISTWLN